MHEGQRVLILDFGSQYTQVIARRVRELGVYCEVVAFHIALEAVKAERPIGLVLSGGPRSVFEEGSLQPDAGLLNLGIPVLGVCYGMQWMASALGGRVVRSERREYGPAEFSGDAACTLFAGLPRPQPIWMSHGDRVEDPPPGFAPAGFTPGTPLAAMADETRKLYGIQFHPEVSHTREGKSILKRFLYEACGAAGDWTMASFIEEAVQSARRRVGKERVLCAISGGVDSAVTALLLHKALGEGLDLLFVDHGLLRKGESKSVEDLFAQHFRIPLKRVDAAGRFFSALEGLQDPEDKRKAIGRMFVEVFEEEARKLGNIRFLAQGTIYPDRIESAATSGAASVIKSHHNVGGLPERMAMKVIEPIRDLFKDEVREAGRRLGLSEAFVRRHPFPGPGLAVRVIGEVRPEAVAILQEADAIFLEEIRAAGLYDDIAQAFAVLLPVRTVGVMGDGRTYDRVVALRAVTTDDFMTGDWYRFTPEFLAHASARIVNEVRGVNRVVYDITSKPPATIEWE